MEIDICQLVVKSTCQQQAAVFRIGFKTPDFPLRADETGGQKCVQADIRPCVHHMHARMDAPPEKRTRVILIVALAERIRHRHIRQVEMHSSAFNLDHLNIRRIPTNGEAGSQILLIKRGKNPSLCLVVRQLTQAARHVPKNCQLGL
jgi:hypothetical protein